MYLLVAFCAVSAFVNPKDVGLDRIVEQESVSTRTIKSASIQLPETSSDASEIDYEGVPVLYDNLEFPFGPKYRCEYTTIPLSDRNILFDRIAIDLRKKFPEGCFAKNAKRMYLIDDFFINGRKLDGCRVVETGWIYTRTLEAFHGEFSSLVYSNHKVDFPSLEWKSACGAEYTNDGLNKTDKMDVTKYRDAYCELGFLCEYAMADEENDFNMVSIGLYLSPHELFVLADTFEKIGKKVDLTIKFYSGRIGERLDRDYFLMLTESQLETHAEIMAEYKRIKSEKEVRMVFDLIGLIL